MPFGPWQIEDGKRFERFAARDQHCEAARPAGRIAPLADAHVKSLLGERLLPAWKVGRRDLLQAENVERSLLQHVDLLLLPPADASHVPADDDRHGYLNGGGVVLRIEVFSIHPGG
jgi:hypothetical protein